MHHEHSSISPPQVHSPSDQAALSFSLSSFLALSGTFAAADSLLLALSPAHSHPTLSLNSHPTLPLNSHPNPPSPTLALMTHLGRVVLVPTHTGLLEAHGNDRLPQVIAVLVRHLGGRERREVGPELAGQRKGGRAFFQGLGLGTGLGLCLLGLGLRVLACHNSVSHHHPPSSGIRPDSPFPPNPLTPD